jgi:hypothetical protein
LQAVPDSVDERVVRVCGVDQHGHGEIVAGVPGAFKCGIEGRQ